MLNLRAGSALERASTLGQNGILAYNGLNVPEVYAEEFTKYYDAGLSGMSIRSADKVTGSVMPEYMKSLAHEAGRLDARAYANKNAPDSSGTENVKYSLSPTKRARLEKNIIDLSNASIKKTAGNKSIKISTDQFSVNKAVYSKKGRSDKEVNARIKAIPDFESIIRGSTYSHTDTNIVGLDNAAKKNVIAMHYFKTTYNGFDVEIVVRDKGQKQFLYEVKFIDNKKSSQQSMPKGIDSPAPKGDVENKSIISQKAKNVKKPQGKVMLKSTSAGFTEGERVAPIDAEGQAFLDKLGKALGIKITYDNADSSDYNGYYINGKMVIARSATKPYLTVVAHETTHRFVESDPKGARAYGNYVIQKMYKGKTLDAEIQRIIDAHEAAGIQMDRAGAMEEICANYTELMLNDVSLFEKLAQENYNIAKKLLDFLKDVLSSIKAAFHGKNAKVDRYGLNHAQMERAARLWQRALRRSEANVSKSAETVAESDDNVTENKNTPEESEAEQGAKYSFKSSKNGTANDLLLPYNDELKGFINQHGNYIVDSFEKLTDVINLAFDKPQEQATAYFGIIPTEILEKIEKSVPNIPKELNGRLFKPGKDYSVVVTLDSIRHLRDDKSLSREDVIDFLNRMADTVVEFDNVHFDYYYESGNKIKGLLFKKRFEDGTMASFEIISNNKRSLNLQTFYMLNGDYIKKKSANSTLLETNPTADVQDEEWSNFNNSITHTADVVNTEQAGPEGKASLKILGEEFADVSVFESGKLKDFTRKKVQRKNYNEASNDEMKSWASSLDGVGYGDFVVLRHLFQEACADVGNEEKINRVVERALQLAVIDAQATFGLKPFEYDADAEFRFIFYK